MLVPSLRIMRELDQSKLSPEAIDHFNRNEDGPEYVDHDRARSAEYTEEVMAATKSALLLDDAGRVVAKFPGASGWMKAEKARSSARVTFDVEIGEDSEEE